MLVGSTRTPAPSGTNSGGPPTLVASTLRSQPIASTSTCPIGLSAMLMNDAGYIWLGRYMLAVVPLITITAGVAIDDRGVGSSAVGERLRWWLLGTVGVTQVVSFVYILRRFSVGQEEALTTMLLRPEWQPALLVVPSIALTAVVAAACVLLVGRVRDASATAELPPPTAEPVAEPAPVTAR